MKTLQERIAFSVFMGIVFAVGMLAGFLTNSTLVKTMEFDADSIDSFKNILFSFDNKSTDFCKTKGYDDGYFQVDARRSFFGYNCYTYDDYYGSYISKRFDFDGK